MKIKVLTSILCAALLLFVISGCGMKMPDDSSASPSGSANGSPSGTGTTDVTTVMGIVTFIDNEMIKLEVVRQAQSSEETNTVSVGLSVYVMTGETITVTPDASTAVIFEEYGFAPGALDDISAGEFLAVVLRSSKVITVIDAGHAEVIDSGTEGVQPSVEPTPSDNEPTVGVPDTSESAAYTVITDGLKARSGPGIEYSIQGVLDKGSRVTGIVTDGWLKFTYDGKTVYCSAEYLEVSTAPAGVSDSSESKTYKTTDNVMARSGPGTTYASLGTVEKGTEVKGTVLAGWLKFTYNDKTAYCSASYLTAG